MRNISVINIADIWLIIMDPALIFEKCNARNALFQSDICHLTTTFCSMWFTQASVYLHMFSPKATMNLDLLKKSLVWSFIGVPGELHIDHINWMSLINMSPFFQERQWKCLSSTTSLAPIHVLIPLSTYLSECFHIASPISDSMILLTCDTTITAANI